MIIHRITIRRIRKPRRHNLNDELQWFGNSLGLFSLRDKDKSCFRIFIELLKASKMGIALSSDELAFLLGLSRGTVIHHINKLMETGIVVPIHKKYMLRESNLQVLMEKIREDFERAYAELYAVAQDIERYF